MASRKKQRKWMRYTLYEAYQVAGALGAGWDVLDNLYAAASGKKPPHKSLLPVFVPAWEAELQTRIVHLQQRLIETEAQLLHQANTHGDGHGSWAGITDAEREQCRQSVRERLVDEGLLIGDEHEPFHGQPWYYLKSAALARKRQS